MMCNCAQQTVVLRDKQVFVRGGPLEEPYAWHLDPNVRSGALDPPDNMSPFTVPPGYLFMMGDNRDDSFDSWFWGPAAGEAILGRAYWIYWPPERWGPIVSR